MGAHRVVAVFTARLAENLAALSQAAVPMPNEATKKVKSNAAYKHGESLPRSPEYTCWLGMIGRCTRPSDSSWKKCGARGIKVWDRWRTSFANFLADMGRRPSPQHSIDRINQQGDYEPCNCRWATRSEQRQSLADLGLLRGQIGKPAEAK